MKITFWLMLITISLVSCSTSKVLRTPSSEADRRAFSCRESLRASEEDGGEWEDRLWSSCIEAEVNPSEIVEDWTTRKKSARRSCMAGLLEETRQILYLIKLREYSAKRADGTIPTLDEISKRRAKCSTLRDRCESAVEEKFVACDA